MSASARKEPYTPQNMLRDVAAMYYLDCMSQEEISKRLYISRSTVSRMLKQAQNENVVTIKVHFAPGRSHYHESKLEHTFPVEAIVINSAGVPELEFKESICRYFARWLDERIFDNSIVGTTRGSMLSYVAQELTPDPEKRVSVVQLMGAESRNAASRLSAQDVVRQFADKYQGRAYFLDAPLVFFNQAARCELLQVSSIRRTLEMAKQANLILTTLPRIVHDNTEHIWKGFIENETYEELVNMGAVGCLFGRAFDIHGQYLDTPLNHSIVSADVEALKSKPIAAICYGADFARAALGALRSGYIKTLVTDTACVEALLALAKTV